MVIRAFKTILRRIFVLQNVVIPDEKNKNIDESDGIHCFQLSDSFFFLLKLFFFY